MAVGIIAVHMLNKEFDEPNTKRRMQVAMATVQLLWDRPPARQMWRLAYDGLPALIRAPQGSTIPFMDFGRQLHKVTEDEIHKIPHLIHGTSWNNLVRIFSDG